MISFLNQFKFIQMDKLSEKSLKPISGYIILLLLFIFLGVSSYFMYFLMTFSKGYFLALLFPTILIGLFVPIGFTIINPNGSRVLTLFGSYKGTVRENGFWWINPFMARKGVSLKARNFDSDRIKVNDKLGNPIMIGVILVWKVEDTYKATFEVDRYEDFVKVQSDAAVRKMAGIYPYDNFDDEQKEITLRSGFVEVNQELEKELSERLAIAGIKVIEARIGYLTYAQEIASAMLRRQQATAIVAARHKIVEGAVSMVEMALDELSRKEIIELDEEKRATMVSNLMVVLCSDKDASPVINAGTLHQ